MPAARRIYTGEHGELQARRRAAGAPARTHPAQCDATLPPDQDTHTLTLSLSLSPATPQLRVGVLLGTALALGGYARVYLSEGVPLDAAAIALALFVIVNASVVAGATLPFLLAWRGVDPAHAGTTVQVVMDVAGVFITCAVCRALLVHAASAGSAAVVAAGAGAGAGAAGHAVLAAAGAAAAAGGAH
jgi:hypothetical protein